MSDEERAAKRKARSRHTFSDAAYRHYDTSNGFGSMDEWIRAAEALAGGRLLLAPEARHVKNADLEFLFMTDMPETVEALKKGWRNAMFIYHPDHGGDVEDAKKAIAAYERLLKNYK